MLKKIDKWTMKMKMIIPKNKSKLKDEEQVVGNKKEIKKWLKNHIKERRYHATKEENITFPLVYFAACELVDEHYKE